MISMNYYDEIKKELIDNEVYKRIKDYSKNKYELERYYNVGKLLVEAQGGEERAKYGDGLIKEYSKKLTIELHKKFSPTLLKNIRQFYLIIKKSPTVSDQLSWSHYVELLKFDNVGVFNCYVVVELKVTELKKEYIGQIELYMNYIDRHVKKINHDKTVGIIIAKKDNKFVMEYCSNNKILRTTYELI